MGKIGLVYSSVSVPIAVWSPWLLTFASPNGQAVAALTTRRSEPMTLHGVAWDSLIVTVQIATVVTAVILLLVLLARRTGVFSKGGAIWRKPLALPAIAFLLSVIIVTGSGTLPIAAYRGSNAITLQSGGLQQTMVVYSGDAYYSVLELRIGCTLADQQTANFTVRVWQSAVEVGSTSISVGPADGEIQYSEDSAFGVTPGSYTVTFETMGSPLALHAELAQMLTPEHLVELRDWEMWYRLGLFAGGFLFLFVGLCYDTGTKSLRDERAESEYLLSDTVDVGAKSISD